MPLNSSSSTLKLHSLTSGVDNGFVTERRKRYIFPDTAGNVDLEPPTTGEMEIVATEPLPAHEMEVPDGNKMYCVMWDAKDVAVLPTGEYTFPSPMCASQMLGTSKPAGAWTTMSKSGSMSSANSKAKTTHVCLPGRKSVRPVPATSSRTSCACSMVTATSAANALAGASAITARAASKKVLRMCSPAMARRREAKADGFFTKTATE
mmetsp:Transcript_94127/g.304554  ORF Transcript_94127/g.304554 Transcript_94127/m.304554 type:complete len:207 (+) Transcript_94127:3696-4316(+)